MNKTHLDEYQNLIELKKFINKYLSLSLSNFNLDTQIVVDYQEGKYLDWLPCHIEAVNVEINWSTFDYLDKKITLVKTIVVRVSYLLKEIENLLNELSYFEIRKDIL